MTHREFLIWLKPVLEGAATTGLGSKSVRALRDQLERMQKAGTLQPFASKLLSLVRGKSKLDAATVGSLAAQVRSELAPPREQTVVLSAVSEEDEKPQG
jgi:hypothetical protein